ncbi:MAG: hypothetical protein GWO02_07450 [Gammaproteobacteria bacterium]|nr:hypothetical protein [Gammaproteobacteria bacterium]
MALIGVAALLVAVGLALWLWALFRSLAAFGAVEAALVTGAVALLVAGVLAWLIRALSR